MYVQLSPIPQPDVELQPVNAPARQSFDIQPTGTQQIVYAAPAPQATPAEEPGRLTHPVVWVLTSLALAVAVTAIALHFATSGPAGAAGAKGDKGDKGATGSFADPTSSLALQYTTAVQQVVDIALDEAAMSTRAGLLQIHRAATATDMLVALGLARTPVAGFSVDSTSSLLLCGNSKLLCNIAARASSGQLALFSSPSLLPSAALLTTNGTGFVPTRVDNTYCGTRGTVRSGVYTCFLKTDLVGATAAAAFRSISDANGAVVSLGPDDRGRVLLQTGKLADMQADVALLLNPLGGLVHVGTESPTAPAAADVKFAVNGSIQATKAYFSSIVNAAAVTVTATMNTATAAVSGDLNVGGVATLNTASVGTAGASSHVVVLDTQGDALIRGDVFYTGALVHLSARCKKPGSAKKRLSPPLEIGRTETQQLCVLGKQAPDLQQLVLGLAERVQELENRLRVLEKKNQD